MKEALLSKRPLVFAHWIMKRLTYVARTPRWESYVSWVTPWIVLLLEALS